MLKQSMLQGTIIVSDRVCVATSGEVYYSRAPMYTLFPSVRVFMRVTSIPGSVICLLTNSFRLMDG